MDDYIAYQKLAFLRKNLEAIEEEKVEEFSMVLAKIYRWVVTAIELRIEDVQSRRNHSAFLRYEREQAIKEDKGPGLMPFTVTPTEASSSANALVKPISPAFVVE